MQDSFYFIFRCPLGKAVHGIMDWQSEKGRGRDDGLGSRQETTAALTSRKLHPAFHSSELSMLCHSKAGRKMELVFIINFFIL